MKHKQSIRSRILIAIVRFVAWVLGYELDVEIETVEE